MLHVILHQPEIPPNTGNIIRLCANTGAQLHLVGPLGFALDDKRLIRAGLDYHEYTRLHHYDSWRSFRLENRAVRVIGLSTRANRRYSDFNFRDGDALLFGSETGGLPAAIRNEIGPDQLLNIPMKRGSRSLNLANSVAVVLFEAWRQLGFND